MPTLEQRIARLEAADAIRQLASRYGQALDARDIATVVTLFVDDGRPVFFRGNDAGTPGGKALYDSYQISQRRYTCSMHFIGNHVIEMDDADHAHGIVYCSVEQELLPHWTVTAIQYWDKYERIGDRWLFAERRGMSLYTTTWDSAPVGPLRNRPPGRPPSDGSLPYAYPTWEQFWSNPPRATSVPSPEPTTWP